MKIRRESIFIGIGIALTVILFSIVTNMKTSIVGLFGVNNNSQNHDIQKELNMSEVLEQQKRILKGIIDHSSYIPHEFSYYDIVNFKKSNNMRSFSLLMRITSISLWLKAQSY